MSSVFSLIKYLDQQSNPEFADDDIELRNKALDVLSTSELINSDPDIKFYQDFILRNIDINSIERIAKFISLIESNREIKTYCTLKTKEFREALRQDMINLKNAVFRFVQENFEEINDKEIMKNFPVDFFILYAQHVTRKLNMSENKTDEIDENIQKTFENSSILKEKEEATDN